MCVCIIIFTVAEIANCVFMLCVDYYEADDLECNQKLIKASQRILLKLLLCVLVRQCFVLASAHISVQPSPVICLLKTEISCSTRISEAFVVQRSY